MHIIRLEINFIIDTCHLSEVSVGPIIWDMLRYRLQSLEHHFALILRNIPNDWYASLSSNSKIHHILVCCSDVFAR